MGGWHCHKKGGLSNSPNFCRIWQSVQRPTKSDSFCPPKVVTFPKRWPSSRCHSPSMCEKNVHKFVWSLKICHFYALFTDWKDTLLWHIFKKFHHLLGDTLPTVNPIPSHPTLAMPGFHKRCTTHPSLVNDEAHLHELLLSSIAICHKTFSKMRTFGIFFKE